MFVVTELSRIHQQTQTVASCQSANVHQFSQLTYTHLTNLSTFISFTSSSSQLSLLVVIVHYSMCVQHVPSLLWVQYLMGIV